MSTERIAVMKFSALGDIAATLPMLRRMDSSPTIITSPLGHAFLKDELSDFLIFPNKTVRSHIDIIRKVRKHRFTDLINLQGNDRSKLFGLSMTIFSETKYHNGYSLDDEELSPLVKKLRQEIQAHTVFKQRACDFIVLNTGSSIKWSAKRLPTWKWIEFAKILHERFGCGFRLTGSADEFEYVDSIAKQIPFETEVLAGKTDFPELKALLKDAHLTISTDSAAIHFRSRGTPTIGILDLRPLRRS